MNTITIVGRLGRDAELRQTPNGQSVLEFAVACDQVKRANQEKPDTDWFSCTIWGNRATALAPHLKKGIKVAVSGRLSIEKWKDNAGVEKSKPAVNVNEVEMLTFPQQAAAAPAPNAVQQQIPVAAGARPAAAPPAASVQSQLDDIFNDETQIPF